MNNGQPGIATGDPVDVLFVLPDLRGGGAERVFVNLLSHFDRKRFVLTLAVGKAEGPLLSAVPSDVAIIELGRGGARYNAWSLWRLLLKRRPAVVLSTLGLGMAALLVKPFLPKTIKFAMRLGNTLSAEQRGKNAIVRLISGHAVRLLYRRADVIICQSDEMLRDSAAFLSLPHQRFLRIYNPVDLARIDKLAAGTSAEFKGHGPHLVSVGRLHKQKGYDVLLQAMVKVVRQFSAATLTIVGEGGERGELETLRDSLNLQERVMLPGFIENPYPYIRRADVFVLASRYEGLSNALLEAVALGRPTVVTNCPGGTLEMVTVRGHTWVAKVEDVDSLAGAILQALTATRHGSRSPHDAVFRRQVDVRNVTREYEEALVELVS